MYPSTMKLQCSHTSLTTLLVRLMASIYITLPKIKAKLFSFIIPLVVVTCKRDNEELIIPEHCYEKVSVPNITKRFKLNELETYLMNGNKRFAPLNKLDELNTYNLEDS